MNVKINKVRDLVFPYKKINYFMIGIIILGIISGAIFFTIINNSDKDLVFKQISSFINSINTGTIDNGLALKNSIFSNGILVIIIWILGMSVIGMFINIFLVYVKSFILGFSISSIIGLYGFKGILLSFIYTFLGQVFDLIAIFIIGIYSVIFSIYIIKLIVQKKGNNNRTMIKRYIIMFIISLVLIVFAGILESYFLPAFMKLIIRLYV